MTKKFRVGATFEGTVIVEPGDFRTRSGNTGGGDFYGRNVLLGPVSYLSWNDGAGARMFAVGPDTSSNDFLAFFTGPSPVGGGADPLNIERTTGRIVISGQLSSSADALTFGDGSGTSVGFRAYRIKGSTVYELWVDGTMVGSFTAGAVTLTGPLTARTVTAKHFGQSGEFAINGGVAVGATATVDWSANGASQRMFLTSATNCTVSMTAPPAIGWYTLKTISPASGTVPSITWPASVKWAGATKPAQAATLGRANIQRFYWDGSNYWGDAIVNAA
jgi:hypothetical protein